MVNANSGSPTTAAVYNGALTREQFLFHEMRTTAKLLQDGLSEAEAIQKIVADTIPLNINR